MREKNIERNEAVLKRERVQLCITNPDIVLSSCFLLKIQFFSVLAEFQGGFARSYNFCRKKTDDTVKLSPTLVS